jgi:2-polyprenyl-6-methoxyphenol hydroxylase-like FAD-dependent oxidoreductase
MTGGFIVTSTHAKDLSAPADFPVVIIGAGPVGMVLALDLAERGVQSVLVEQAESTLWYPKGNTHNARTMEHYRRLGLADAVRATGLPVDHPTDVAYFTRLNAHELQRLSMPSTAEKLAAIGEHGVTDQVPEPLHRANQMYVERMLVDRVRKNEAITCLFSTECTGFTADDDGVEIRVAHTSGGEDRRLTGRYLVGCDGPRSLVRRTLGISYQGEDAREQGFMSGLTHSTHVRIPDLHKRIIDKPAWQYWVLRPGGVSNFVNLDAGEEFLYHAMQGEASDDDAVRRLVIDCIGEPVEVEILGARDWIAGRALVAERFGEGRVFLCGDAVHLFTPTGGFGMNTGIDDAANLAWKLTAAVQGWAGPELLASYEQERRPVAVRNTRAALGLAKSIRDIPLGPVLEADTVEGRDARSIAAEVLAGFTHEFASMGIQLGARYDGSPVVAADGTTPPADLPTRYLPTACPGGRAPHVWLSEGRSLFDALGPGFTLLRLGPGAPTAGNLAAAAAERGVPLTVLDVPLAEARELYERDLVLVRPDQHVAWRGNELRDAGALLGLVTGTPRC